MKAYLMEFFYRSGKYPDIRKFFSTWAWFLFYFVSGLKILLILIDVYNTMFNSKETDFHTYVPEWFIAVIAGKAGWSSFNYSYDKKVRNGHTENGDE